MKTITAIALILSAAPALADDYACRRDDPRPGCHILNDKFVFPPVAVSESELHAQQSASRAHTAALLDRLVEGYGHPCRADFQPVWIAERCNASVFGEPMGSTGGSD